MHLRGKKGFKEHKDLKRKHFKRMMLQSTFDKDDLLCKKKHFKRMMKARSMLTSGHHGKWKHFKGMRGQSSSDSDDSDHHQGKGKHFKRMRGRCMSHSDDDHRDKGMQGRFMPDVGRNHHHDKGKHFKGVQGRSMSHSDDEGIEGRCMSENEGSRHHGKMHFMGMRGRCMTDIEEGRHGRGKHFKGMRGRCMSHSDDDRRDKGMQGRFMPDVGRNHHHDKGKHFKGVQGQSMSHSGDEGIEGRCMSDNEGSRHHGKMHFMGMRGRCMTDIEEGRHGRGKHFKGMRRGHMADSDDSHHGKHIWGMMHHQKGKHWMKGHGRRGFFDKDSALVPICATEGENRPETLENENTGNQTTEAAEVETGEVARTRDQGTQTSGIMEIIIEDQEAQNAAIRIVNKFL